MVSLLKVEVGWRDDRLQSQVVLGNAATFVLSKGNRTQACESSIVNKNLLEVFYFPLFDYDSHSPLQLSVFRLAKKANEEDKIILETRISESNDFRVVPILSLRGKLLLKTKVLAIDDEDENEDEKSNRHNPQQQQRWRDASTTEYEDETDYDEGVRPSFWTLQRRSWNWFRRQTPVLVFGGGGGGGVTSVDDEISTPRRHQTRRRQIPTSIDSRCPICAGVVTSRSDDDEDFSEAEGLDTTSSAAITHHPIFGSQIYHHHTPAHLRANWYDHSGSGAEPLSCCSGHGKLRQQHPLPFFFQHDQLTGSWEDSSITNEALEVSDLLNLVPQATIGEAVDALRRNGNDRELAVRALVDLLTDRAATSHEARAFGNVSSSLFGGLGAGGGLTRRKSWMTFDQWKSKKKDDDQEEEEDVDNNQNQPPPNSKFFGSMGMVKPSGRKRALLIGISYAGSKNELAGPLEDHKRVRALLTKVYGFNSNCILDLVDTYENAITADLKQFLPTKENMLHGMRWLVHNCEPGDFLFFHYSGHGGQKKAVDGYKYEEDGLDETILPLDYKSAGHIRDDDMNAAMIKWVPAGVRMVGIMDSCHSGTGFDLPYVCKMPYGTWGEVQTKSTTRGDVTLIAGCKADETSADLTGMDKGSGQEISGGAMTMALLSTLSARPFDLTYYQLLSQINRTLRAKGLEQNVQLSCSIKFELERPFRFDDIRILNNNNN